MTENHSTLNIEVKIENIVENEVESNSQPPLKAEQPKPQETQPGVTLLRSWLNKSFRVEMTDGRVLIGIFLCTDRDANIILGSCSEYLPSEGKGKSTKEEPRMLGLVMIPGKHIVNLQLDSSEYESGTQKTPTKEVGIGVDVI